MRSIEADTRSAAYGISEPQATWYGTWINYFNIIQNTDVAFGINNKLNNKKRNNTNSAKKAYKRSVKNKENFVISRAVSARFPRFLVIMLVDMSEKYMYLVS